MKRICTYFLWLIVLLSSVVVSCDDLQSLGDDDGDVCRITVLTSGNGCVSFSDSYEDVLYAFPGDEVTVVATPDEGYDFAGWFFFDSDTLLSTDEIYTFTVGDADIHLFAKFEIGETTDDFDEYSKLKEAEREAIDSYIRLRNINVISYEQFIANGSITDASNNEYVLVDDVYMQIVNNPKEYDATARSINDGDVVELLVRYCEYDVLNGDTLTTNIYSAESDEMRVANNAGSYVATFMSGVMNSVYGSAVPAGWLVPLRFLSFTRKQSNHAKVNIIVPHIKGTSAAASAVCPAWYAAF